MRAVTAAAMLILSSAQCALAGVVSDALETVESLIASEGATGLPDWLAEQLTERLEPDPQSALAQSERWGGATGLGVRSGVEWRVMYGVPTDSDRDLARATAARTLEVLAHAERVIESASESDTARAARDRSARASAILPLASARALLLLASCAEEQSDRVLLIDAAGVLLARPIGAGAWFEAERAMLSVHALHMSGRHDQALDLVAEMALAADQTDPAQDLRSSKVERILTRALATSRARSHAAARGIIRSAIASEPFTTPQGCDWRASALAAAMHARLAADEANQQRDPASADAARAQAFVVFEALAHDADTPEHTALMLDEAGRVLAYAPQLAGASDTAIILSAITNPDHIADALRLTRIINAGELPETLKPEAQIVLMRALSASSDPNDRFAAADHAIAFVDAHPDDPRAPDTLAWGAALAASVNGSPHDEPRVSALLARAIAHAPRHPAADDWRAQLASSLTRRAAGASSAQSAELIERAVSVLNDRAATDASPGALLVWAGERAEDAGGVGRDYFDRALEQTRTLNTKQAIRVRVRALVGLGRDSAAWGEARELPPDQLADARVAACIALTRLDRAEDAEPLAGSCSPDERTILVARLSRLAWDDTEPYINRFYEDAQSDPRRARWGDGAWRLIDSLGAQPTSRVAWGLLLAGDPARAEEVFTDAIARTNPAMDLTRGLGEALFASGDDAGAFSAFRQLVRQSEHDKSSRDYWHAQARLAEILVTKNADGSRTDTIARLIRRLRAETGWDLYADCARKLDDIAQTVGIAQ